MKSRWHDLTNAAVLIALWLIFEKVTITMIAIPFIYLASAPDKDQGYHSHRNWLLHSIIPIVLILPFIPSDALGYIIIPLVSIGLHLLCDIKLIESERKGYYTIVFFGKRLNGRNSTIYLLINFIISLIILIWWLL